MKKCIVYIVLLVMILNVVTISSIGTVYASDAEIWLDKNYDEVYPFAEGFAQVVLNGKSGYIDKTGKQVGEIKYDYAYAFSDGLGRVELDGKSGFINQTGKEIIPLKFDYAYGFTEGLSVVELGGQHGYIDKNGEQVVECKYDDAFHFSEGLARVVLKGKSGYIDKNGKQVIPLKFTDAHAFSEGLAQVKADDKYGYIDKTGKEVVPFKYDNGSDFSDGLAMVVSGNDTIYVNQEGKEVFKFKYDYPGNFSEGLSIATYNDKSGYVNKTGNVAIPFKYEYAGNFTQGLASVMKDNRFGFIDKAGKEIIPFKYDNASWFSEGLASVELNDKSGYVDKSGKEVIPLKYDYAYDFSDGVAIVSLENRIGIVKSPLLKANDGIVDKEIVAEPTRSKVLVNGKDTSFDAYAIKQNNYFKLRDLALVVSGTNKQFEVTWDGDKKAINLISNKPYTKVGGEMNKGDGVNKTAAVNTSIIYKDGVEVDLLAYTINGNNYFKLRDIASAFDIGVTWDSETKTIGIDTTTGYVEEGKTKPEESLNQAIDLTTEKSIRQYLVGEWLYEDPYLSDIACKMNIDEELNVKLSFENSYSAAPKGNYKGKITFDRIYAESNEGPDVISLELTDTDEPGGDFFFLHRTIYDNKRVMSWFPTENGNSIFNVIDYSGEYLDLNEEVIFEKITGEKSKKKVRENGEFYAVLWGLNTNADSIWLDDVEWTPGYFDYSSTYPAEMTGYKTDTLGSVLYSIASEKKFDILNDLLIVNMVYLVETDNQGRIIKFTPAEKNKKKWIDDNFTISEIQDLIYKTLKIYDEPRDYLDAGMSVLFTTTDGKIDCEIIDGIEYYFVSLGTDHEDRFVREVHYALDLVTKEIYWFDVINNKWEPLGMG